jgi:glycosyltransferase involved in cell wall biosynthesis
MCGLAGRLDRERFDVQVLALRGGECEASLRRSGTAFARLGRHAKWGPAALAALAELLRRDQVDLLHTHLFGADLAGRPAASIAAVPHVVHTVYAAEGRFRPWRFAFARFFSGRCDRIICVSPSLRDWHARRSGLPRSRYAVIPHGIDARAFDRDDAARRRLREEWGIGPAAALMLFLGRLHRDKGIDTLLAAMAHLSARGNPQPLVLVGDGPARAMVETFISHGEGGERCRWLGFREDVREILSAADVFVGPSRWETTGLAFAEAMAAGVPVVATKVPLVQDLVVHEETGLLVEAEDVVALAEAIERLAGDAELRAALGAAGRRRVVESCSVEAAVAAHERLYLEVAGEGFSH